MFWLQLASIFLALVGPVTLWHVHRRLRSERLSLHASQTLAALLAALLACEILVKWSDGKLTPADALPMQLCDWALFSVIGALLWRSQTCFELAYFWGLAGTFQALVTPAISHDLPWWRHVGFFLVHAGIVAGVLLLLLVCRMRPRGIWRVIVWSELYLTAALAVNHFTGGNYGFLAHKPSTATMLDLFSDTHWIYVAQINGMALVFFAALYVPWAINDAAASRHRR